MNDTSLIEETLGESLIPVLLAPSLRKDLAGEIAAGWKADHLSLYRQEGNLALAWITSWKDAQRAQEFHRNYRSALERHHRIAFAPLPGSEGNLASRPTHGGPLYLQVKGNFVLLLTGGERRARWKSPKRFGRISKREASRCRYPTMPPKLAVTGRSQEDNARLRFLRGPRERV